MTLKASAFKSRHKNAPRPAEKSAPGYLQWLRGRHCAVRDCLDVSRMHAAHVDHGGDKGMGTKASDRYAIPLCGEHHATQHRIGWRSFEARHIPGGDAVALAAEYWRAWPGRIAWEAKNG